MARHPWVTDGPGTRICDACGARQQRTSAGVWQPEIRPDCPNLSDDADNPPGDRPPPVKPLPPDPDYDPHPKPDPRDLEELVDAINNKEV